MSKYGFSVEESNAAYNAAIEMAEWKEQQMIEKACKIYHQYLFELEKSLTEYDKQSFINWLNIDGTVEQFKQAMKGDNQ